MEKLINFKKKDDEKVNNKTDVWEELGIEPYDESLPVVYGKEYFDVGEWGTFLKKKKLPKDPFCLIVPADLEGFVQIEGVKNLVDIVWLSSYTSMVDDCPALKRIVYACETEFEKCEVGYAWDIVGYECPSELKVIDRSFF